MISRGRREYYDLTCMFLVCLFLCFFFFFFCSVVLILETKGEKCARDGTSFGFKMGN